MSHAEVRAEVDAPGVRPLSCGRRHRYRAKFHGDCHTHGHPHWHVICRACSFGWVEPTLFDPRRYEAVA